MQKKEIRKTVVHLLKKNFREVYTNNAFVKNLKESPSVVVSIPNENFELLSVLPRYSKATIVLKIEILKKQTLEIEEEIENETDKIIKLMTLNNDLLKVLDSIKLQKIEYDYDAEGDDVVGGSQIIYKLTYTKEG
ncbi:hypothetical protein CMO94_02425 [Candidatus Woesearchaeota archaeon]|mgnify:CR=1 FL=1|nr:hypothetical protein [Candidatus Woesearchaeota archaeon]